METTTSRTAAAYEIRDPASTVAVTKDGEDRLLITVDWLYGVPRAEAAAAVRFIARAPEMTEALTVAASGLAEILASVDITIGRLDDDQPSAAMESLLLIREAVESLRASTQAAAEGR